MMFRDTNFLLKFHSRDNLIDTVGAQAWAACVLSTEEPLTFPHNISGTEEDLCFEIG
jgi:hypothetical protein